MDTYKLTLEDAGIIQRILSTEAFLKDDEHLKDVWGRFARQFLKLSEKEPIDKIKKLIEKDSPLIFEKGEYLLTQSFGFDVEYSGTTIIDEHGVEWVPISRSDIENNPRPTGIVE